MGGAAKALEIAWRLPHTVNKWLAGCVCEEDWPRAGLLADPAFSTHLRRRFVAKVPLLLDGRGREVGERVQAPAVSQERGRERVELVRAGSSLEAHFEPEPSEGASESGKRYPGVPVPHCIAYQLHAPSLPSRPPLQLGTGAVGAGRRGCG